MNITQATILSCLLSSSAISSAESVYSKEEIIEMARALQVSNNNDDWASGMTIQEFTGTAYKSAVFTGYVNGILERIAYYDSKRFLDSCIRVNKPNSLARQTAELVLHENVDTEESTSIWIAGHIAMACFMLADKLP